MPDLVSSRSALRPSQRATFRHAQATYEHIAFAVATFSRLLLQCGTIGLLVPAPYARRIAQLACKRATPRQRQHERQAASPNCAESRVHSLLGAVDEGAFGAESFERALRDLDIDEVVPELRDL